LPKVHFLVVGPSNVDHRLLSERPNVHLYGRRDRADIPHLLRRCSASLVPFKKTRLTERILPLKVFEALAAGATPVCTAFSPDLQVLAREGLALLGDSPRDFACAVELAIARDEPLQRSRLQQYGRAQTWEARWAQMSGILESILDEPARAGSGRGARLSSSDNSTIKHEDPTGK
jgi:glycosyltransferase involved in cell wall biosynthesis